MRSAFSIVSTPGKMVTADGLNITVLKARDTAAAV
jgi:hypothetical protein